MSKKRRGTPVIDREVPGIGRFKVATGTNNPATVKHIKAMIGTLKAAGRLDILQAIHDRVVTPLEVWDAFRMSELDRLPSAETIRLLWSDETGALASWRKGFTASVKHLDSIKTSFAALEKIGRSGANVGDLPDILKRYRAQCEKAGYGRSFNLARSHCQAFLRDTLGRSHRLYRKVGDLKTLPVDRAEGNPMTVTELDELIAKLPPKSAAAGHDMAMTGMGPKEYWGKWSDDGDRVRIHGTKRKGRLRTVPKIADIGKPALHPRTFANHLQDAGGKHEPYDFRRTYAHLLEEAGIPRTRRKLYMGHAAGDVLDLYERSEVDAYITADAEKLRAYLSAHRATPTTGAITMKLNPKVSAMVSLSAVEGLPLKVSNLHSPDPESYDAANVEGKTGRRGDGRPSERTTTAGAGHRKTVRTPESTHDGTRLTAGFTGHVQPVPPHPSTSAHGYYPSVLLAPYAGWWGR